MIFECEVLNFDQLKLINSYYDDAVFKQGTIASRDDNVVDETVKKTKVMDQNTSQFRKSLQVVQDGITKSSAFKSTYILKEMTVPMFTEYDEGCHYELHVDNVTIQGIKTHHSITIFLNEPDEYEGGALLLTNGDREWAYKCKAGSALIYPTGLQHRVEPVTSGSRRVALCWATSLIDDFFMRNQILSFGKSIEILMKYWEEKHGVKAPPEVTVPFEQVRTNFIREYGNLS